MARKSNDSELREVWQEAAAAGDDGMRRMVERVVQQVLEAEMTAFVGADSYERTGERRGYRNGYKPRTLKTRVGELELMVPKDRDGQFQTELFERYQRSEKALVLAITQMYVEGVSTRKVRDITEALCGLEISKSQVSALSQRLDAEVEQWRERSIEKSYPYLMIDARYEKIRRGGEVISQGVLLAVGVSAEGYREVLGVWVADSESEASWGEVFSDLSRRGLRGVQYLVSDDHQGMRRAIERHFQGVVWQRCQVHFVRNLLHHTAARDKAAVLAQIKTITEAPTLTAARKAIRGSRHAGPPKPTGSCAARSTLGRDPGRLPTTGRASQAHALDQYARARQPRNQTKNARDSYLSQRAGLCAPGQHAHDGTQSGMDGTALLAASS